MIMEKSFNVKLGNSHEKFFDSIRLFCQSNDLDYKKVLHFDVSIISNNEISIIIENTDSIDYNLFNKDIFYKITI